MAGKFVGVLTCFMDDHYADRTKPILKREKVQEPMHPANRSPEGVLYAGDCIYFVMGANFFYDQRGTEGGSLSSSQGET